MQFSSLKKYPFIIYLVRFIGIFCILFYGTIGVIGLTSPGGYYSSFIDHYFNYVAWLRSSLLYGAKTVLSFWGFETYERDIYNLQMPGGRGVHIAFDCLGYGVMSFWAAFIIANEGSFIKKVKWIAGGLLLIWVINVLRISLLLVAINKHWGMPLGLNHHTWFNIAAYSCIFAMIYIFDTFSKHPKKGQNPDTLTS
jgi:exosortase/archaeosortase family protein